MRDWQNLPIWEKVNIKVLKSYINEDIWKRFRLQTNLSIHDLFSNKNRARNLLISVVEQHMDKIIEDWNYHIDEKIYIPKTYNENLSLPQLFQSVIEELIEEIDKKITFGYIPNCHGKTFENLKPIKNSLEQHFLQNRTRDELADEIGCSRQQIDNYIDNNCLVPFFNGEVIYGNIRINEALKNRMDDASSVYKFDTVDKILPHKSNSGFGDKVIKYMKLDILNVNQNEPSVKLFIPRDEKWKYTWIAEHIFKELQLHIVPIDKESFVERLNDRLKNLRTFQKLPNKEYDENFIDSILGCERFVEWREDRFFLKPQFLNNDQYRVARIIYDAGEAISTDDIRKQYECIYHRPLTNNNLPRLRKFNCSPQGKIAWIYGEEQKPILTLIKEFAKTHKIFYFTEIQEYIKDQGDCRVYNEGTIRTYITSPEFADCAIDLDDANHFCRRDNIKEYQDYRWAENKKYGATNWVAKQIKEIFDNHTDNASGIPIENITRQLREKANNTEWQGTNFSLYIRNKNISGDEDSPFIIEDGYLKINEIVYFETNFESLGFRNDSHKYYDQIRAIIIEEALKTTDGRIRLADLVTAVNAIITDVKIQRNKIIAVIEYYPQDLRIEKIDEGHVYVVYDKTKDEIAPRFAPKQDAGVEDVSLNQDIAEAQYEEVSAEPQDSNYQPYSLFDWSGLKEDLINDLNQYPYNKWMPDEMGTDMASAIEGYMKFMQTSTNEDMKKNIPQNIYDYYKASTSNDLRKLYMGRLAIHYEALLCEIYKRRYNVTICEHGFRDVTKKYYPDIDSIFDPNNKPKGFDRIIKTLSYIRRSFAHGQPLNTSTGDIAKNIVEFTALYIYTIAKYYYN